MMRELISIIIPSYNKAEFLAQSISSALNQSYPEQEVIIIDDGSTDGSLRVIESFGDSIRYAVQANQGAPAARNHGLSLAKGEWIKFLDADDLLLPDALERQAMQMRSLPTQQKAIVYGDTVWVNRDNQPISGYLPKPIRPEQDPIAHILAQSPLTSSPLHKRSYLQEIGGFDVNIPKGQEHDLHLRLALEGVQFIYQPGPIYHYREYQDNDRISGKLLTDSGSINHFKIIQNQCKLIEAKTGKALSESVRKVLARHLWALGRGILREGSWEAADKYFQFARQLHSKEYITGRFPYPLLVNLTGPRFAEICLQRVKRIAQFQST